MALLLQQKLASSTTGLVGGCPPRVFLAGGGSRLLGEHSSACGWRTQSLHIQLRKKSGMQQRMGGNAIALLRQQTSSNTNSPAQLHSCEGRISSPKVFEDQAEGICCYRSPSGEVTCEGYDEGPYFHPAECCNARTAVAKSSGCESSYTEEAISYNYVKKVQGKSWCEGKDEC